MMRNSILIILWCEALSLNRLRGATLENQGVLHSVWPGSLWTNVSPIRSRFKNPNRDGIAIVFDDLSHGLSHFFIRPREPLRCRRILALFGGHDDRKHENEAFEAAKEQT